MTIPVETLESLFEPGPHRHRMGLRRADALGFYGPSAHRAAILAERARWMGEAPASHVAALPGSAPLLNDFAAFLGDKLPGGPELSCGATPLDLAAALAHAVEADWLLMPVDSALGFPVLAASVCFPSAWALEEKIGHPLREIHAPVPGLNTALGDGIQRFLERLEPGAGWERFNWGLSRSPELNQHPRRGLRRLEADIRMEDVWWRVEQQSFIRLESCISFGIQIHSIPLAQVAANEKLRTGMIEALATMQPEIAAYKGLGSSRVRLLELLRFQS